MKQVYMPPRNRGYFVQDMPPRRVNLWPLAPITILAFVLWFVVGAQIGLMLWGPTK